MDADFRYDAFISYRRSDGTRVARWLRHALQGFRAPGRLRELRGRRLVVYLDTVYERGTQDFFEHNILPALRASRFLIVLATPEASLRTDASNDWMQREIDVFAALPQHEQVIAVRGAGDFAGPLPAGLGQRYPQIELVDLRDAGSSTLFSPRRASRLQDELLKVAGPLLGVTLEEMPELRREQERRQQLRIGLWAGTGSALVVGAIATAFAALQGERHAIQALQNAAFATERAIQSADGALPPGDGPTDSRGQLLDETCDLRDRILQEAAGNLGTPRVRRICELERVRGLLSQSDKVAARLRLERLVSASSSDYDRSPDPVQAIELLRACDALKDVVAQSGGAIPPACHDTAVQGRATTWHSNSTYRAQLSLRAVDRAIKKRAQGQLAVDRKESATVAVGHWREAARLFDEAAASQPEPLQRRRIELDRAEALIAVAAFASGGRRTSEAVETLKEANRLLADAQDPELHDPDLLKDLRALRDKSAQLQAMWKASPR